MAVIPNPSVRLSLALTLAAIVAAVGPPSARAAPEAAAAPAPPPREIKPRAAMKGHELRTTAVAFSPDGRTLASGDWSDPLRLWDVATATPKKAFDRALAVRDLGWLPAANAVADLHSEGGQVIIKDLASESSFWLPESDTTTAILTDPKANVLIRGDYHNGVSFVDPKTGKASKVLKGDGIPLALDLSADGGLLAAGCYAKPERGAPAKTLVHVWDVKAGKLLATIPCAEIDNLDRYTPAVRLTPDGRSLLFRKDPETFGVWDLKAGKVARTFDTGGDAGLSVEFAAFSPDGRLVAGVEQGDVDEKRDAKLYVWDTTTGKALYSLTGLGPFCTRPAFSPDGSMVAAGSDKLVMLWSLAPGGAAPPVAVGPAAVPAPNPPVGPSPAPAPAAVPAPAAAAGKAADEEGIAWVRDHNAFGPAHPIVQDMTGVIRKHTDAGQDFAIRFGAGLMKSGRATQVWGVGGKLFVFELTDAQAAKADIPKMSAGEWGVPRSAPPAAPAAVLGTPAPAAGPADLGKGLSGQVTCQADKPLPAGKYALRLRYRAGETDVALLQSLAAAPPPGRAQPVKFAFGGSPAGAKAAGPVAVFLDLCRVTKDAAGGTEVEPVTAPVAALVDAAPAGGGRR